MPSFVLPAPWRHEEGRTCWDCKILPHCLNCSLSFSLYLSLSISLSPCPLSHTLSLSTPPFHPLSLALSLYPPPLSLSPSLSLSLPLFIWVPEGRAERLWRCLASVLAVIALFVRGFPYHNWVGTPLAQGATVSASIQNKLFWLRWEHSPFLFFSSLFSPDRFNRHSEGHFNSVSHTKTSLLSCRPYCIIITVKKHKR